MLEFGATLFIAENIGDCWVHIHFWQTDNWSGPDNGPGGIHEIQMCSNWDVYRRLRWCCRRSPFWRKRDLFWRTFWRKHMESELEFNRDLRKEFKLLECQSLFEDWSTRNYHQEKYFLQPILVFFEIFCQLRLQKQGFWTLGWCMFRFFRYLCIQSRGIDLLLANLLWAIVYPLK